MYTFLQRLQYGHTALIVASWFGELSVVKELLRAHANPDTQDQVCGLTSLMLATQKGREDIVEVLLDANADPNITENVRQEMVAMLFNDLCCFSLQTAGWTALHFAAKSGNLVITKQLLLKGANTEIKDNVNDMAIALSH